MDTSESITKLMMALGRAQVEMEALHRNAENPYFHSNYADLAACIGVSRGALQRNGLVVLQAAEHLGESHQVKVETRMVHESGEWVKSIFVAPVLYTLGKAPNYLQCVGLAMTYSRRYGYSAMVGLAQEDDDAQGLGGGGNGEQSPNTGKGKGKPPAKTEPPPGGKTEPPPAAPNPQEVRSKVRKEIIDKITMSVKGVDDKLWPDGYLKDVKVRIEATKKQDTPKGEYAALRVILNEVAVKGHELCKADVEAPKVVTYADAEKLVKGAGLGVQETSFYLDSLEGVKGDPQELAAAYAEIKAAIEKQGDLPLDEK